MAKKRPYKAKGQGSSSNSRTRNPKREQPRKDSDDPRVNFDNTRKSKFEKDIAKDMAQDHNNDVSWYSHNPELLRAAGNYGFSYLTGSKLPFVQYNQGDIGQFVPGVMAMLWKPSFGGADIEVVNQAADQIYNFVVHGNSRNTRYSAADLFTTICATSNCFAMVSAMIRAYGAMNNFSDRNDYTPKALVTAMGFDYDDLQDNLAQMWFDINHCVADLGQLWLPKDMPFVARQFWMNANVYTDANTSKAQYYLYVQTTYLMYQDIQFDTGTSLSPATYENPNSPGEYLEFQPSPTTRYPWSTWMATFRHMVQTLIEAEDRGTMLGDVLKAYGRENLYTIAEIPSNYRIVYTYSQEVLTQFENLNVAPSMISFLGLKQEENTGRLVPYFYGTSNDGNGRINQCPPNSLVLNFHQQETPTPEQIMVATRMMSAPGTAKSVECVNNRVFTPNYTSPKPMTTGKYTKVIPRSTGTEVCTQIFAISFKLDQGSKVVWPVQMSTQLISGSSYSGDYMRTLYNWCAFDWAPWLYVGNAELSTATNVVLTADGSTENETQLALGDWDNYTILRYNDVFKLHVAAVYSEFGIPMM